MRPQCPRAEKTCPCRNVHISVSASWIVGELVCWRVGLSASWFVGDLVVGELVCRRLGCRRIGLSASWIVDELVCRRVGLSATWIVGELVCRRLGCRRNGLSASWIVAELVCQRLGLLASWSVGELVCQRVVQLPYIPPGEVTQIKLFGEQLDKICSENDKILVGMDANARNFWWDQELSGEHYNVNRKMGTLLADVLHDNEMEVLNDGTPTFHKGTYSAALDINCGNRGPETFFSVLVSAE